jgi:hypothetical protein
VFSAFKDCEEVSCRNDDGFRGRGGLDKVAFSGEVEAKGLLEGLLVLVLPLLVELAKPERRRRSRMGAFWAARSAIRL